MATKKGRELAAMLGEFQHWTLAMTETCSLIMRNAATLDRLAVEECNGPAWADRPTATPERLNAWGQALQAKWDRTAARITCLVESFPDTDSGPITVRLGGDPRGFVVVLVVPRGEYAPLGIGLSADGIYRGVYVEQSRAKA